MKLKLALMSFVCLAASFASVDISHAHGISGDNRSQNVQTARGHSVDLGRDVSSREAFFSRLTPLQRDELQALLEDEADQLEALHRAQAPLEEIEAVREETRALLQHLLGEAGAAELEALLGGDADSLAIEIDPHGVRAPGAGPAGVRAGAPAQVAASTACYNGYQVSCSAYNYALSASNYARSDYFAHLNTGNPYASNSYTHNDRARGYGLTACNAAYDAYQNSNRSSAQTASSYDSLGASSADWGNYYASQSKSWEQDNGYYFWDAYYAALDASQARSLFYSGAAYMSQCAADLAPNNAQFISQSVPTQMVTGQSYSVTVVMKNTGTATWTAAANYRLGSQNPQDNWTWGTPRVNLPGTVASGAQASFTFTVTAPASPGNYNFQWRMIQEGVEWFGASSTNLVIAVTSPSGAPPRDAAFVSQSVPTTMTKNTYYNVTVTMKNTGSATWTASAGYRLGSQNPQDNLTWGVGRVNVPASIAPNGNATFSIRVKAPATAGTYNFQWRMLQEGVEWFGEYTPNLAITVR